MGIATQIPWVFQFGAGSDAASALEVQAAEGTQAVPVPIDIFLNDPFPSASAFLFSDGSSARAIRSRHSLQYRCDAAQAQPQSKAVIELGEGTIEEMSEALARTYPHWFQGKPVSRDSESVRIILPHDLARQILHWGYRMRSALCYDKAQWRSLIKKRLDGQELTAEDRALLERLHCHYQTEVEKAAHLFHFWGTVLKELAVGDSGLRFEEQAIAVARHDIGTVMRGFRLFRLNVEEFDKYVAFYRKHPEYLMDCEAVGGFLEVLLSAQIQMGGEGKIAPGIEINPRELLKHTTLVNDIDLAIAVSNLFLNLFSNVLRYSDPSKPEGVKVIVRGLSLPKGSIQLTIGDNGIGIQKANLAKLGEDRFREGRKAVEGSQGIGLSSVIATLNGLGVPLWVRSEEGVGTEFRLILPGWILMRGGEAVAAREDFAEDLAQALEESANAGFIIPIASRFSKR